MRKSLKLILLFILLILLVWRITISYSLIRERKQEKNLLTVDKSDINVNTDKKLNKGTLLTEEDHKLGVVAITEREEHPTYIFPAMVKLIPRETILGVKKGGGRRLFDSFFFIFPYFSGGFDSTRSVKLDPYWIGCYEVTLQEFEKFLKDTNQRKENILVDGARQVKPNRPVVGIHRRLAIEYCEWLSKKTGMKFRLPTEDEWEYAARSGYEQKPTPYGDEMPFEYYDYFKYSKYIDDVYDTQKDNFNWEIIHNLMHDVGSFPPTRYHLYDMGGNVREWTYHDYAPDIYRIKDTSWYSGFMGVYHRFVKKEDFANIGLGFRLVREVDD